MSDRETSDWCSRADEYPDGDSLVCGHNRDLHTPKCEGINAGWNDSDYPDSACGCPEFVEFTGRDA